MMLAGPPGTGKTTSIMCLSREMLGDRVADCTLELNASDDRGIDVVRNNIKDFACRKVVLPPGRHKIVILDEVDAMTEAAQQALRRLMELHSDTTRFALACNQSSKVIEPIQSRCCIVRFSRLKEEQILRRLQVICRSEKASYTDEGLAMLTSNAEGDMRHGINNLQSTVNAFGLVSLENVLKVCDTPPPRLVNDILTHCMRGRLSCAHFAATELVNKGYNCGDIVGVMRSAVKKDDTKLLEHVAVEFLQDIAKTQLRFAEGVENCLQLE